MSFSDPVNGELGSKTNYTYTIIDDDEAPEVLFEGTPYTVDETAGNKTISIALSQIPGKTTSVDFATANWTAFDDQDYTNTSGTLIWVPGESGSKISVCPLSMTRSKWAI